MRLSRAALVGATVVVVGGGSFAAYAENSGPGASYRTAVATTGDVEQTLALSGTLSPAGRSNLAFATSGTVATVAVAVGQHVRAGQVLARLDPTSLTAALTRAQAQLDSAEARLASDESAQVSAATTSSASTGSTAPTAHVSTTAKPTAASNSAASNPAGTSAALVSQMREQQTAVTTSQTAASSALAAARSALAGEQQACAASASGSASGSASASPSASASASASSSTSTSTSPSATVGGSTCDDAIAAVQEDQAKVDQAQSQLQQALDALATTLSSAAGQTGAGQTGAGQTGHGMSTQQAKPSAAASPTASASTKSTGQTGQTGQTGRTGTAGQTGTGGRTVTAATLASDQAGIDAARASLVSAQQALAGAVLRSAHAGTVGQVDVTTGHSASAGSTAVVVLSPGATDVDLAVSSAQVATLSVGQVAEVTPAGATEPLTGTVARITPVPDSSGNYPVTVTLAQDGLDLPAGGTAAVDIVVGKASGVLTVPTSAVAAGTVEVLDGTTLTRTRVTIGLVGSTRTQISAGLQAGQQVVLADIAAAVPTSTQQNGFGRFGGGFGGTFGGSGGFGGLGGGGLRAPAGGIAVPKG